MNPAGSMPATTAESSVTGEATTVPAAGMTTAVLRPEGHSQEESAGREVHQATHTNPLYAYWQVGSDSRVEVVLAP